MRIFDLETASLDTAADYVPRPDLDAITAAKNLKDSAKIAADIEQRKSAALVEYADTLAKAALDWNVGRIVAIGYTDDAGATIHTLICRDALAERAAIVTFWDTLRDHPLCGFCSRTFDVPYLIQRSRYLDVPYPATLPRMGLARYGRGSVLDLRDVLTFDDLRYRGDYVMPQSLKAFAHRFGIPVPDAIDGADISEAVKYGDWKSVEAHVSADVVLTAALAVRLGYVKAPKLASQPSLRFEMEDV